MAPLKPCSCDGVCDACEARRRKREAVAAWRQRGVGADETFMLAGLPAPGDWAERGRCRLPEVPVSLFFPDRYENAHAAKTICAACPVLAECRAYALAAPAMLQGVWGGMSTHASPPGEAWEGRMTEPTFAIGDVVTIRRRLGLYGTGQTRVVPATDLLPVEEGKR